MKLAVSSKIEGCCYLKSTKCFFERKLKQTTVLSTVGRDQEEAFKYPAYSKNMQKRESEGRKLQSWIGENWVRKVMLLKKTQFLWPSLFLTIFS